MADDEGLKAATEPPKRDISKPLSMRELALGPDGERFDHALAEAIENALDLNRSPKAVRSVTLTVKLAPIESDLGVRSAGMSVEVKAGLAPLKPTGAMVHFGISAETGSPVAMTIDPAQLEVFKRDQPSGIIPLPTPASAEGGNK
jgi:hypothetical protein